jgi:hypothetical protein
MNKIVIAHRPSIGAIRALLDITGVYSKDDIKWYEEPGKVYVRVAFGRTNLGENKVELNAFTGDQVTMQVNDAKRNDLTPLLFASFWDNVVDQVKEWVNVDTGVEIAGSKLRVSKARRGFIDEYDNVVLSFDVVKKLASFMTCMLIMFTVAAQMMPVKTKAEIERDKQIAAYEKMMADPVFQAVLNKATADANPGAKDIGMPTELNMRIPVVPRAPKVPASNMRIITVAPIYTSPFESTIMIRSLGGSRKDESP